MKITIVKEPQEPQQEPQQEQEHPQIPQPEVSYSLSIKLGESFQTVKITESEYIKIKNSLPFSGYGIKENYAIHDSDLRLKVTYAYINGILFYALNEITYYI